MNAALAARVRQLQAGADHRQAVREFRARRKRDEQNRIGALLSEVVAVLAEALEEADHCDRCAGCMRALSPRRRNCPHCGYEQPQQVALSEAIAPPSRPERQAAA